MSTEVLREAAKQLRNDARARGVHTCECMDGPNTWFDRTICPEPCGSMHTYCNDCGLSLGTCLNDLQEPKAAPFLRAVADWLDEVVFGIRDEGWVYAEGQALAVARAYLGRE